MIDLPPAADRSRTPSAQMVALLILVGGSFSLVAAIILVVTFGQAPDPVRLLLAGLAGSLLSIPQTVAGFYFGSSIGSAAKTTALVNIASDKDAAQ